MSNSSKLKKTVKDNYSYKDYAQRRVIEIEEANIAFCIEKKLKPVWDKTISNCIPWWQRFFSKIVFPMWYKRFITPRIKSQNTKESKTFARIVFYDILNYLNMNIMMFGVTTKNLINRNNKTITLKVFRFKKLKVEKVFNY